MIGVWARGRSISDNPPPPPPPNLFFFFFLALLMRRYAVRGEVVMRADDLASQGRHITMTNIGNPHAVGQKPLTFFRQVLALCDLPAENGVDHPDVAAMFPSDAVARAKELRAAIGSAGTGSYTNSQGVAAIRHDVADFITTCVVPPYASVDGPTSSFPP